MVCLQNLADKIYGAPGVVWQALALHKSRYLRCIEHVINQARYLKDQNVPHKALFLGICKAYLFFNEASLQVYFSLCQKITLPTSGTIQLNNDRNVRKSLLIAALVFLVTYY